MAHPALAKILAKLGVADLAERLSEQLTPGQLTTLLLPVFARHSSRQPHQLLADYQRNRFVHPADSNALALRRQSLAMLTQAETLGFTPLTLSPLSPLGCASSYGKIHQNNVLSALRGCEVLADPSNLLALELCKRWKTEPEPEIHACCSQRVVRTTKMDRPELKPHFEMFVACSLLDGSASLTQTVLKHLNLQQALYTQAGRGAVEFRLEPQPQGRRHCQALLQTLQANRSLGIKILPPGQGSYYQTLRAMSFETETGLNLGDMGLVDWPAQLLSQKRLMMVISGIGVERLLSPNKISV